MRDRDLSRGTNSNARAMMPGDRWRSRIEAPVYDQLDVDVHRANRAVADGVKAETRQQRRQRERQASKASRPRRETR